MNNELKFLLKVARNGLILASMSFFSMWASQTAITFDWVKPIIIFLFMYVLGELSIRYKLNYKPNSKRGAIATLIF